MDALTPLGSGVEGGWNSVGDGRSLVSHGSSSDGSQKSLDLRFGFVGHWVGGRVHGDPCGGLSLDLINNVLVDWVGRGNSD